jgi:hypothetical protein
MLQMRVPQMPDFRQGQAGAHQRNHVSALQSPLQAVPTLWGWWPASGAVLDGGGLVTSLPDASGNGRTMTPGGATGSPAFRAPSWTTSGIGGQPALVFDGATSYQQVSADVVPIPIGSFPSVWGIAQLNGSGSSSAGALRLRDSVTLNSLVAVISNTAGAVFREIVATTLVGGTGGSTKSSNVVRNASAHLFGVYFDGTVWQTLIDKSLKATDAASATLVACDQIFLAALSDTTRWDGMIADMWITSAAPTSAQVQAFQNYASLTYGTP